MSASKKSEKLGINVSTASARLLRDILFDFISKSDQAKCFRCGKDLTRDTFSIEHKISWLNSEDPKGLFFDLENISYSHQRCNILAAVADKTKNCGTHAKYRRGCRCDLCKNAASERKKKSYSQQKRREQYLKHGH